MKSLILHILDEEKSYLPAVKGILSGRAQVYIDTQWPTTAFEYVVKAKKKNCSAVVSSSETLLRMIVKDDEKARLSDYAGSIIQFGGLEFLFVDPLEQLMTIPYGKFVFKRFTDKIVAPDLWLPTLDFRWELFEPGKVEEYVSYFDSCDLIGCDIETPIGYEDRGINCISFSGGKFSNGQLTVRTICVPTLDLFSILFTRLICSSPVPKVFQNGKYDIAYLLRYGCPVENYLFDTINLFHSWLCELPKDLGFINAFMLRNYKFHKNAGKTGDKYDYYGYNAEDSFTTLLSCLALLVEIPSYAEENFLQEFPVVFPCILSEHTGMKYDDERRTEVRRVLEKDLAKRVARLGTLVGAPGYNPNSPTQSLQLIHSLGSRDIKSTDEKSRDKVSSRHPLNEFLMKEIDKVREFKKEIGSYYKDSISWKGRCFYALNPHGTDTGRLASRESQFWCGLQIQNIKRDSDEEGSSSVKECFQADEDFFFGEADYSQAETRDTAYLSGDTNLLAAVADGSKDFHGRNASAFFGVPYEEIVATKKTEVIDEEGNFLFFEFTHKTVHKVLRDLSKRTNHGSNYNMGPQVLLDTMGSKNVIRARDLLKLPARWELIKVCDHLLQQFDKTYPVIRDKVTGWYGKVISDVNNTGLLVGPTGWTRKCFGQPSKNKRHLNSYVAHPPQSLNAMTLNRAYLRTFQEVWLPNQKDFRLCAQIHDSILFQYRKSREDLVWKVAECMRIPTEVTDTFGTKRILIVPVDVKGGAERWSDVRSLKMPLELRKRDHGFI